jgi:carbon monoxide dehydrogenase subunit G
MLQFEGERTLSQDLKECWNKLTDPRFISLCIPDVELVGESSADQVRFKHRPGVSFIRATLDVTVKVEKIEIEKSVRYLVHSRSIGASSDAEASLALNPVAGGTHVNWNVNIKTLGGLLKAVPQGLIKASAEKVLTDIWSAVEKVMNEK